MIVLVGLFVLGVMEIWTAVVVAQWIGALATAVALVLLSVLGVLLVRSEGTAVWRRVNDELASGRAPTGSLLDGLMVLVGGMLLILPGFLTAIPGLLLLVPPTRSLLRPVLQRWIERRAQMSTTLGGFSFATFPMDGQPRVVRRPGAHSGRVVDADCHDSDEGSAGSVAYAEVIDVEVVRPRELDRPD